ncbi:hypothetical protein [Streptomyces sp. enrichment culture]|uniref:hypothetical protein n=1 Tax=Streptomyces sp. enrichment culture TaxID=1795815 RepID=UPI003F56EE23
MTTVTSGAMEQLEELVRALKEGSTDKVTQALAKAVQNPQPGGKSIDIEGALRSAVPQGVQALADGVGRTASGAADTLGNATKPFGVWEAETPEIVMGLYTMLGSAAQGLGNAVASLFSGGGGGGERKPGTYDSGYDASRDAQN